MGADLQGSGPTMNINVRVTEYHLAAFAAIIAAVAMLAA